MILRIVKYAVLSFGCIFLLFFILCFTSLPFWTWYGLSTKKAGIHRPPECIVVLGGGGMPSESGLMRCWYAAKLANWFPKSSVIIALPGDLKDSLSSVNMMKQELVVRGIAPSRIRAENQGTNTRSQALQIFSMIRKKDCAVAIVSSPEHIYRAVSAFKKAGFTRVDGLPAFENAIESDITFTDSRLGGRRWVPDLGKNITLRYRFWTQMRYEELILREYVAIIYYRVKGWL